MDNLVLPRIEMAVRSITGSSGHEPNSVVQNPDQLNFSGNTENTPLMMASNRTDLNIDKDKNDGTRNAENFEDGDFPALRPNYERNRTLITQSYYYHSE